MIVEDLTKNAVGLRDVEIIWGTVGYSGGVDASPDTKFVRHLESFHRLRSLIFGRLHSKHLLSHLTDQIGN